MSLSRIRRNTPRPITSKPGNRRRQIDVDQVLQRQEADRRRRAGARSGRPAAAAAPAPSADGGRPCRCSSRIDDKAAIGNERERMRRVDRQRRQHRKDLVDEVLRRARSRSASVSSPGSSTATPASRSSLAQAAPDVAAGAAIRSRRARAIAASCSAGVRPSWLSSVDARSAHCRSGRPRGPCRIRRGCWPRSTGSAAAPAADGAWLLGLLEHALVERQPRQFAVDEAPRAVGCYFEGGFVGGRVQGVHFKDGNASL